MIEIKEVKTKKQISLFAKFPVKLYEKCPYYVPSFISDEKNIFNPEKNFSLADCKLKAFLCYKDDKLVGRIAGIISYKDNEISGKKFVRFSRLECVDDIDVFKALLGAVERFGGENGMEIIHGPWGFNDTDREGLLTYGFEEKSTYATNYSYPYFAKRLEELGFAPESKWLERRFKIQKSERINNFAEKVLRKYNFKEVANGQPIKKVVKKYGDKMFETFNESYRHLDGFTEIKGKEKANVLSQFATIVNTRYISMLEDENGDIASFAIVLPSIADALIKSRGRLFPLGVFRILKTIKKPKELEMALIGVKDKYKNTGINAIMISKILNNIVDDKVQKLESNPMLETNFSIQQQWKFSENEVVKKRQTFVKDIGTLL